MIFIVDELKNFVTNIFLKLVCVDAHFGKPSRKKKPSNMGREELVSG